MVAWGRPRIGISACILGRPVRFDGGHRESSFVTERLGRFVDFVSVCPEIESGMSVPREPLRLVSRPDGHRLLGKRSGEDHTERMESFSKRRIDQLGDMDLDGFVLKKDSPSCGLERVRVHTLENAPPSRSGTGIFAARLRERLPALPLAEEGWLCDRGLRESFLDRIFTHQRMRAFLMEAPTKRKLEAFHSEHELLVLAHSPEIHRELGRLVTRADGARMGETVQAYEARSMAALGEPATPIKRAHVLRSVMGHLREFLTAFEVREVSDLIEDFSAGFLDFLVPLTLIVHHLRKHERGGRMAKQFFFHPFPRELFAR